MNFQRPPFTSPFMLLGLSLFLGGCSKEDAPTPVGVKDQGVTPELSRAKSETTPTAPENRAPTDAMPTDAAPTSAGPVALGCAPEGWERFEVKALQDGGLSVPTEGAQLPQFSFLACDDKKDCFKLALGEGQSLLAVGQNGNDVRIAVSRACGDDVIVWLADGAGKGVSGFRGHDIAIEKGVIGGDRLLLSGIARHRSDKAKNGFTPREYLFTVRSSAPKKVEVARNKQGAVPVAAASQIVVVEMAGNLCTTMFWKLGVEQCDFQGPASKEYAAFGSHIVFESGGTGKTYGTKDGERELLPALDWVVSDGVNVAWSSGNALSMTQPKYDLPTLSSGLAPGAAGSKPLAIGCQRLLSREGGEYRLRNVKLGSEWRFPTSRLPEDSGEPVALGCDKLFTDAGYTLGFGAIGKPAPIEIAAPAPPAPAATPAPKDQPTTPAPAGELATP